MFAFCEFTKLEKDNNCEWLQKTFSEDRSSIDYADVGGSISIQKTTFKDFQDLFYDLLNFSPREKTKTEEQILLDYVDEQSESG